MFWTNRAKTAPELAQIGINFLVMEPTSVPSERTNSQVCVCFLLSLQFLVVILIIFLQAKNVVTDRRFRLNAESIQKAVCLKSWYETFPHDEDFFLDIGEEQPNIADEGCDQVEF